MQRAIELALETQEKRRKERKALKKQKQEQEKQQRQTQDKLQRTISNAINGGYKPQQNDVWQNCFTFQ